MSGYQMVPGADDAKEPNTKKKYNDNDALIKLSTPVLLQAWIQFIAYEIFVGYDRLYSPAPLCPHQEEDFGRPEWYVGINYACLGGFFMIWSALAIKISLMGPSKARSVMFVALNIVSMGMIATVLAVVYEWGGVCVDMLNVASPAAIWAEWIACGPLLIFITVTVVDKAALSQTDLFLMVSFWVCLVTGYFIMIPSSLIVGEFWLFVSCLTYIPVLYLPFYDMRQGLSKAAVDAMELHELQMVTERFAKQRDLSIWLTIVLPLYTVFYLMQWYNYLDYLQLVALYQILSVLTKGLFAAVTMDMHADLLIKFELREEQRANEARRAFMKYLFHEVRTPLNSLTMGIDMLKLSDRLQPAEKEYLSMMSGATDFMSDTLNNVLNMHKIEEGKLELEQAPFSVVESASKVMSALHGMVAAKNIVLVKDFATNVPSMVIGDRYRIEHVISNFVSNACKFSPDGGQVVVSITSLNMPPRTRGGSDGYSDVTVVVTDQGCGISPENQEKLFRNFVQIRPSTLQKGQGSGLGLALCKAIVDLHEGGKIGVRSEEGHGSSFFFTIRFPVAASLLPPPVPKAAPSPASQALLQSAAPAATYGAVAASTPSEIAMTAASPAAKASAAAPAAPAAPAPPSGVRSAASLAAGTPTSGQLVALVVDDAETNRKMLAALVTRMKVHAVCVEDGQLALNEVQNDLQHYKLVLMDNLMPVMNGVQAASAMRQARFPHIIAGVTGNVMEDDVAEYLDAGADVVFSKPVRLQALKKLLAMIEKEGPMSRPGMTIVEKPDVMEWAPRQKGQMAL